MKDLLENRWVKVLVIATTIAMCSFALRETASITRPVFVALRDVLVPVAIGFAIAYVITPAVDAVARLGLRRLYAAGLLFGLVSAGLGLAMVLVVPATIKQSVNLSLRIFQGEPWTDLNGNGRLDPGEPFEDLDRNGQRDEPLMTRGLVWLEESQNQLKVGLNLGLDDQSLKLVAAYEKDLAPLHRALHDHLAAAREGQPAARWPTLPTGITSDDQEPVWPVAWPFLSPAQVAEAAAFVPAADREAWQVRMAALGEAAFRRHGAWIGGIRQARRLESGATPSPEAAAVLAAWGRGLVPADRRKANQYALDLREQARAGNPAARELLAAAGGTGEHGGGGRTLAALVEKVESSVKSGVDAIPATVGGWAKGGFGSVHDVLSFAIDVLLVPIYAFFLVLAMPAIRRGIKTGIPALHAAQVMRITRAIEQVVAAFFRGRLLICAICAGVAMLAFALMSLAGFPVPYGTLFGLGIGLATAIPLAGLLFAIPAAVLAMLEPGAGPLAAGLVLSVYALVSVLDSVLIPVIMGRNVELHPVTLIIALLLCGKLLGVLGLLLAVPIAATFRILAREFLWPWLTEMVNRPGGLWGPPPPPAQA
jgi:predicted PurR-regulated permease PerM